MDLDTPPIEQEWFNTQRVIKGLDAAIQREASPHQRAVLQGARRHTVELLFQQSASILRLREERFQQMEQEQAETKCVVDRLWLQSTHNPAAFERVHALAKEAFEKRHAEIAQGRQQLEQLKQQHEQEWTEVKRQHEQEWAEDRRRREGLEYQRVVAAYHKEKARAQRALEALDRAATDQERQAWWLKYQKYRKNADDLRFKNPSVNAYVAQFVIPVGDQCPSCQAVFLKAENRCVKGCVFHPVLNGLHKLARDGCALPHGFE